MPFEAQSLESDPSLKARRIADAICRHAIPRAPMRVDEWADRYRMLSRESSAEPGPWRTSRVPYLSKIMEDLSASSPTTKIVWAKGSQIAATETGNCWLGYVVDYAPGPMLMVMPTEDIAKRNSRTRIQPMVESCPQLADKFGTAHSRDRVNTVLEKHFPGGMVVMCGANSPAPLRSMPARYVMMDEVDGYPGDIGGEGDPIALATARTATYARSKKIYIISTPTIEGQSRIWSEFEQSDQHYYYVPCPHCGHYQLIEWARIKWMPDKKGVAALACEECGVLIEERHKTKMLAEGEWRPHNEEEGKWRGYHLSSLYSPLGWYSWAEALVEWSAAQRDVTKLKSFINTKLGEPWRDRGQAPDWEKLFGRAEDYPIGTVPQGALVLVAGVDVQRDRLEVEVVGYGPGNESWSIDYRVLPGDTAGDDVWRELDMILDHPFPRDGGGELRIRRMAVDSGYNTQRVYAWCRSKSPDRVIAVKGSDNARAVLTASSAEVTTKGKTNRKGLRLWTVGASLIKQELYGWLQQPLPEQGEEPPSGWCHFPKYEREYFKMLTAEELTLKTSAGRQRYIWVKVYDRNESLDCRVYARSAAISLGVDRWADSVWTELMRDQSLDRSTESARQELAEVKTQGGIKRKRGSGFWS